MRGFCGKQLNMGQNMFCLVLEQSTDAGRKWKHCQLWIWPAVRLPQQWDQALQRVSSLSPLLSCTRLPPPDMSTLVKSWPYRELYGLIRPPCDGTGPDMSLWAVAQRHRGRRAAASKSPSVWSELPSLFGRGQPPHTIAHTVRAKARPKGATSCRRSIGGFRESGRWIGDNFMSRRNGEELSTSCWARTTFRAHNWSACKNLDICITILGWLLYWFGKMRNIFSSISIIVEGDFWTSHKKISHCFETSTLEIKKKKQKRKKHSPKQKHRKDCITRTWLFIRNHGITEEEEKKVGQSGKARYYGLPWSIEGSRLGQWKKVGRCYNELKQKTGTRF